MVAYLRMLWAQCVLTMGYFFKQKMCHVSFFHTFRGIHTRSH
jgi:hypothetical protein